MKKLTPEVVTYYKKDFRSLAFGGLIVVAMFVMSWMFAGQANQTSAKAFFAGGMAGLIAVVLYVATQLQWALQGKMQRVSPTVNVVFITFSMGMANVLSDIFFK